MPERITQELLRKRAEHNEGELSTLQEVALHQFDIEKIENLDVYCRRLKILYLQHNQIGRIENLHRLKDLEYLNLALNNITVIENLERCESLRKLDLTVNFIEDLLTVESLKPCQHLRELFLVGNPCTSEEGYREFVIATLPQLKSLDGSEIEKSHKIIAAQEYAGIRERLLRKRKQNFGTESSVRSTTERPERASHSKTTITRGDPDTDNQANQGVSPSQDSDDIHGRADEREQNGLGDKEDDFARQHVPHTPEARLETARELARRRAKPEPKPDPLKPPPRPSADTLIKPDGRVLQRNEPKVPFNIDDTERAVLLSVDVSKFVDTSLVSIKVESNYVRVTVKGKVLQLSLAEYPADPNRVHAQRSLLTGRLVLTMAKRGAEFTDDEVSGVGICGFDDTLAAFAKNERAALDRKRSLRQRRAQREGDRLRGKKSPPKRRPVPREAVDYRNIVAADGNGQAAPSRSAEIDNRPFLAEDVAKPAVEEAFVDDPDVPPLI